MRRLQIFFLMFTFFACNNSKPKKVYKPSSSGNINNLLLVIDDDLWGGRVGDVLRENVGSEIYGLPQIEPYFDMRQVPIAVFTDFVRLNRIVLKVQISDESGIKFYKDPYASPQTMVVVSAEDSNKLIDLIKTNSTDIISSFRAVEIKEKQRRINKSLFNSSSIKTALGVDLKFSSAYRIAKAKDNFFWIRRDTDNGSLNLLLYSTPIKEFNHPSLFNEYIIQQRDSVAQSEIPGPHEGDFMTTDESYTPSFFKTKISGLNVLETRSVWKVNGAFMSGPFVNYCFLDKSNGRFIIAEGFVYAPAKAKREYMLELEAMIRSISID